VVLVLVFSILGLWARFDTLPTLSLFQCPIQYARVP